MNKCCIKCGEVLDINAKHCESCGASQLSSNLNLNRINFQNAQIATEMVVNDIKQIQSDETLLATPDIPFSMGIASQEVKLKKTRIKKTTKRAEEILKTTAIKNHLCPALKSLSNDVYEIAKVITPILIPLIINKTIEIPLDTFLFASISILLARMGVEGFCSEVKTLSTKHDTQK